MIVDFEKDLDYLTKNFKPISLAELIALKKNGFKTSENYFHITFDDGLSELYNVVAPILLKRKIPATFFINTDFIDNNDLFYRFKASILAEKVAAHGMLDIDYNQKQDLDELAEIVKIDFKQYLETEKPYLTSSQIKELILQGFTIGAHSKNHPLYNMLSEEDQLKQTLESLDFLKNEFQLEYSVFSFPFTDDGVGKEFFKKIESKVDITFGSAGIKKDSISFNLQRIPMETNLSAEKIIKTQYFYCLLKKIFKKNIITRL
ncbi:MAG TPA: polysaccharide deacetylase family protein [Vicingus sp.]|nr:polysaccharide deacetylase family protein [Flavobacteriales bacterium]HRN41610.1 polysaccharide deacetylase family protein [Vicingus sp.]HRP58897.1 polysaccharide deacetylase family protein [Vicingus sp.]